MQKILLLDDGGSKSELAIPLMQQGFIVAIAPTLQSAWDKLSQLDFDWMVLNRLNEEGVVDAMLEGLEDPDADPPRCKILLLSKPPTPPIVKRLRELHLRTMDLPCPPEKLIKLLEGQLEAESPRHAKAGLLARPKGHELAQGVQAFIGSHPSVMKVIRQVERVAGSDSTVLLLGESGTGKELIAQSIHYRSPRATKALIPVNCGAIPGELLESELFGHAKGAFSGATAARQGRFALADGGTLFLDEVGEMPLNLQVKLLRALQEREITPLGSTKTQKVDVRIIAATNQNLEELVERKLFREDLFYRLNVIPINLPPLRERAQDIPELIQFFMGDFNERLGSTLSGFETEALEAILNYPWPGNIRELKNVVERLAILNDGELVRLSELPEKIQRYRTTEPLAKSADVNLPDEGVNFYDAVEQFEKALILQALDRTNWNKNQAASLLSMNRTTLVEKIKKKELARKSG
ncbi:MAG: sigma-54 interaction domain-containing protein [Myxococcota bacterium]